MNDSYNDSYSEWTATPYYDDYESSVSDHGRRCMNVVSMVLHSITFVLGIPGNAFVIWIAGVKMKNTVNTIWYVNLAVADLLCCLVTPFLMALIELKHDWPYGAAMCKVIPTAITLNMFASVFTLTLISLDRFTLIIYPVWAQNHRTISRAWLLCGLAWFLALLLSLPQLIYSEVEITEDNRTSCLYGDISQSTSAVQVTRTVFGFLVPLLVMTVCYVFIARRMNIGRFKSQKALWIMVGVVIAFFVCWMPYHTVSLVIEFEDGSSYEVADAMFPLAESLACLNSCLNPVLYVFMGQKFKERVRISLRRIFENAFNEDPTHSSSVYSKGQMSRVSTTDPTHSSSVSSKGQMSRVTSTSKAQV